VVWFPKLLTSSGITDFRLNGAKLCCVFFVPEKTILIAGFADKLVPDKRGFTVMYSCYFSCLTVYVSDMASLSDGNSVKIKEPEVRTV